VQKEILTALSACLFKSFETGKKAEKNEIDILKKL